MCTIRSAILLCCALLLGGCASLGPPRDQNDVCRIFAERPDWLDAARDSARRWDSPISLQMAIIWRESSFRHDARPPKKRVFFGLIPWGRISSAYGYSQALDGTWDSYLRDTGRSSYFSSRDDFGDAIDFVGWYTAKTRERNGLSMGDGVSHYLAYHEGHGGYKRGSYRSKQWLLKAARQVGYMAQRYRGQLATCGGGAES